MESDDFEEKHMDVFFHVMSICKSDQPDDPLMLKKGRYQILPNTEYEISIYHFHPGRIPDIKWLKLSVSEEGIAFTSNPVLIMDSPYDLKSIRFIASGGVRDKKAHLTFRIVSDTPSNEYGQLEFDLPLLLRSNTFRNTIQVLVIGAGVSTPAIIGMYVADKGSIVVAFIMFLAGCVAGIASLLRYQKGV